MFKDMISADSHITEPPNCYKDYIVAKYKDDAPYMAEDRGGDIYYIPGFEGTIPMGLVAAAGKDPKELRMFGTKFEELHPGGWDPKPRIADQERDGVAAEMIYPSVGMLLCGHDDIDYKQACMEAYNRWLEEFCGYAPNRLYGLGQAAIKNPAEGIKELKAIKAMGFKGVMMPGDPGESDYDDLIYDPLWEAAVELDLPLSFHILTTKGTTFQGRGPKINAFQNIMRSCQDIMGMFVFSGVFERHPNLRLVCVEADVGWAPHFMYRMDHAYKRHRAWLKCPEMDKLPSEYFRQNIWLTFQDDWTAFKFRNDCNIERIMWANDFPHSDSTWPWSQELLAEHSKGVPADDLELILRKNVSDLYRLAS
jgi:predicted TIM-barrel fold metal-dependent hydrolase